LRSKRCAPPILAWAKAYLVHVRTKSPRPIISHLFSRLRLLPVAHPWLGALLRALLWAATLGYFAFALLLLALRYSILPQIENYRGDIERMIGTAINRPVGIPWPTSPTSSRIGSCRPKDAAACLAWI